MHITRSAVETQELGRALAAHLKPGDVVCLYGELGAGKTTYIQGLAAGLGVRELVSSPSFTLVHEHQGRLPFYHIDLYRVAAGELAGIGIEDILGTEAVVAVEWAERMPPALRGGGLDIEIAFDQADDSARRIRLRARGCRGTQVLNRFSETPSACAGD
jgi:tRNA threonylcarbamoyladenosine biosynthesis protein TsaE